MKSAKYGRPPILMNAVLETIAANRSGGASMVYIRERVKADAKCIRATVARLKAQKLIRSEGKPGHAKYFVEPPKPEPVRVVHVYPSQQLTFGVKRPAWQPPAPVKRGPAHLDGPMVFTDQTRVVRCPNMPQPTRTNTHSGY